MNKNKHAMSCIWKPHPHSPTRMQETATGTHRRDEEDGVLNNCRGRYALIWYHKFCNGVL